MPVETTTAQAEAFFGRMIDAVSPWAERLGELFSDSDDAAGSPTRRSIDAVVEPLAMRLLTGDAPDLVGAGFVAAAGVMADARWHMAWWQGARAERLQIDEEDAAGEAYARREWFARPMEQGISHLTGPYVDFLCTDEYTVTVTVPVVRNGRSLGVVGADVLAATLEESLGRQLRLVSPGAALLNSHGRVIVSADPTLAAGTLLLPGLGGAGPADAAATAPGAEPERTDAGMLHRAASLGISGLVPHG